MRVRTLRAASVAVAVAVLTGGTGAQASPKPPPPGDPTLSVVDDARGGCQWSRWDPLTDRRVPIATFDFACDRASLAWSQDGRQALVDLSRKPKDETGTWTHRLWLVDLTARTQRPLTLPPVGELERVGFDRLGVVHALTIDVVAEETEKELGQPRVHFLRYADQKIIRPDDFAGAGEPCLAHDFSLAGGAWRHDDVRYSLTGARLSPNTNILPITRQFGPTSWAMEHVDFPWLELDDSGVTETLEKVQAPGETSRWMQLAKGQFSLYALVDNGVEPPDIQAVVQLEGPRTLVISRQDHGGAFVRAPFLLLNRPTAKLYNLTTRKAVWSRSGLHQALFWPLVEVRR